MTKKPQKAIAYNLDTLVEKIDAFGQKNIGIPLNGSEVTLDKALQARNSNILYSDVSEEKLKMILERLGWNKLIQHNFGTPDYPQILDRTCPLSYVRLVRLANDQGFNLRHFVTHEFDEARAAAEVMYVSLIGYHRRIRVYPSFYEMAIKR